MKAADSYNSSTGKWNASALYIDQPILDKGGINSDLLDKTPIYEYDFENYLLSWFDFRKII